MKIHDKDCEAAEKDLNSGDECVWCWVGSPRTEMVRELFADKQVEQNRDGKPKVVSCFYPVV